MKCAGRIERAGRALAKALGADEQTFDAPNYKNNYHRDEFLPASEPCPECEVLMPVLFQESMIAFLARIHLTGRPA